MAPAGLIPVPDGWQERYYVAGGQLTIDPTPTYTLTRRIRYGARHELTGDPGAEVYERLTVNGARIALLYARYLALSEQANAVAGDGWRYAIGDETVDKTRQGDGLRAQAEAMLQAYRREVQALKGYGQRRWT
ncbi:hypothetical protein [Caldilinea sp.]|uniref:hypothetical protein n=1 Tax=Caldilinea sp. TaxID=2293560 RepID=UPI00258B2E66|nr:hypothetical protein [Caldilinea sp.]